MYHVLDDAQARPPLGTCERCGGELWGAEAEEDDRGRVCCPTCRTELAEAERRAEVALDVLEAVDTELKKYLSDELRNTVWNEMVRRFPVKEAG